MSRSIPVSSRAKSRDLGGGVLRKRAFMRSQPPRSLAQLRCPCPHPAFGHLLPKGEGLVRVGPLPLGEGGRRPDEGELAASVHPVFIGAQRRSPARHTMRSS